MKIVGMKQLRMSKSVWESKHSKQMTETSFLSKNNIRNNITQKILGKMYALANRNQKRSNQLVNHATEISKK